MSEKSLSFREALSQDFTPSLVLFLISLPLSMGVAIASGVPPAMGLVTAVIGGIVVGILGGSHLQIAGPSAGLTVLIFDMVHDYGLDTFSLIVVLAGGMQLVAGLLKLGPYFRAVSPAVIQGMLSGIGLLIMASQFHVAIDQDVQDTGLKNLLFIPQSLYVSLVDRHDDHRIAALIGLMTLTIILFWERWKPKKFHLIPGQLLGVVVATTTAFLLQLEIKYVTVPSDFFAMITFPPLRHWLDVVSLEVLLSAGALAFVATAETLLCANALPRMREGGPRTRYNKELRAQGVGNFLCGICGVLPVTGVISRSSVNVAAGAKTKYSCIMHAVWIALFVFFLPEVLSLIPTSCLAAVLVYVGYKLLNIKAIKELVTYGRSVAIIFAVTITGIVVFDLLVGIVMGFVLSAMKLLYVLSHIEIDRIDTSEATEIFLHGSATFLALPQLGQELEDIRPGSHVCFHVEDLHFIDHACLDMLSAFKHRHEEKGGKVTLEWDTLLDRYDTTATLRDD